MFNAGATLKSHWLIKTFWQQVREMKAFFGTFGVYLSNFFLVFPKNVKGFV